MSDRPKPTREAMMRGLAERVAGHFQKWLEDPKFKAALHRYDHRAPRPGTQE
jgi:hypothetical protein